MIAKGFFIKYFRFYIVFCIYYCLCIQFCSFPGDIIRRTWNKSRPISAGFC